MTFLEALQSGKPFRRPQWKKGLYLDRGINDILYISDFHKDDSFRNKIPIEYRCLTPDLLATDYELYQPTEKFIYIDSGVIYNNEPLYRKVKP